MPLNVAIVGCAHGHFGQYVRQWAANPYLGVKATACWDHNVERMNKTASDFGLTAVPNLDDIINDADIDAFVITSETSMHAELVEKLAPTKKPIALQKPMALTMSEADRIVKAVNENQCPFTMAWQMRVDPQNIRMREIMENGSIGKVFQFRRKHNLGMALNKDNAKLWHFVPELNRDIWADDAAHPIDLIHWLFGVPASVTAEIDTLSHAEMPDDNGVAIFRYPNGPLVTVACSFSCAAAEISTEIYGSNGCVVQKYGDAVTSSMPRNEGEVGLKYYVTSEKKWYPCEDLPSPTSQAVRIGGLAKPLADFFLGNRDAIATAEDARDSLAMVLATIVSSVEGRRVKMDDPAIAKVPLPKPRG